MNFLTDIVFQEAVTAQPNRYFDSHAIIRWLLENRPYAYARELGEYAARNNSEDPFPNFHSVIAQQIGRVPRVGEVGEITSLNIRGKFNTCKLWEKVS